MKINTESAKSFLNQSEITKALNSGIKQLQKLKEKTGKGNDFLGWMDLPNQISDSEIQKILKVSKDFQQFETVVVIGIGGSYLGSKAIIDLFKPYFKKTTTEILFAGQNLDEDYLKELLDYLSNRNFGIIVISKSGTTLEPALAFRLLLKTLIEHQGDSDLKNRIVAITDKEKGALRSIINQYQLVSFIVPNNIGGRYSVLSPVGLLPIAIAGIDIKELINSTKSILPDLQKENIDNPAIIYAVYRNLLYQKGFSNEIMVYSKPKWNAFAEWWKQLFGESEGKEHKGIFPVSINITTDLHSLGQYVQEGERKLFETFIRFTESQTNITLHSTKENFDQLNYLETKSVHFINSKAEEGTINAHYNGGVPILEIELEKLDVKTIGQLIYFYEISCAISGYLLDVNPFDQPGVEAYKKQMFNLLGK